MAEGPLILLVSDDDGLSATLAATLDRYGYRLDRSGGAGAGEILKGTTPEVLILDGTIHPESRRDLLELLETRAGRASLPLLVLTPPDVEDPFSLIPGNWHEDAYWVLSHPPQAGEILTSIAALRRLAFYRTYRALVHDLSQPVTILHALSRSLDRAVPEGDDRRDLVERLTREAERLMTLMESFQRGKAGLTG